MRVRTLRVRVRANPNRNPNRNRNRNPNPNPNVSLSNSAGCLWLSLQYANTLLLVDVKNLDANGAPTILNEYKACVR